LLEIANVSYVVNKICLINLATLYLQCHKVLILAQLIFIFLGRRKYMPQFVITYLGGDQPSSPEEGKQHMAKYMEWLSSLGDSAVSPANPFKDTHTVKPDGTATAGSTTTMSGYTIIKADSMEAALEIVKGCPFLDIGGSLEVSELMQMPGPK
jgi:hypothetical protein